MFEPPGLEEDYEETTFWYDEFIKETHKSWLLKIDNKEYWLPKAPCQIDRQEKWIYIPEWLAIEKGLV